MVSSGGGWLAPRSSLSRATIACCFITVDCGTRFAQTVLVKAEIKQPLNGLDRCSTEPASPPHSTPLETCGNFCYSTHLMITAENKAQAFALTQTHKTDVGSPQAQVSVLTSRIKEVTEHLKLNKHDHMARRGLVQMVGRRKRLLKYLEAKDFEAYKAVVAKLGLRK